MPGKNLTRDEAAARAALLEVASYDVQLDLTGAGATYPSITEVVFTAASDGETFIDLIAPAVREITLNSTDLDPAAHFDGNRIMLPVSSGENRLRVVADAAYMNTGEGLHRFVDPVDDRTYLYTQFEVADARRMFTCFDQPDLKATFALTVLAPADWTVFSNSQTPAPQAITGQPGTNADTTATARWQFEATPRVSTYITALVAGDYHVVRDSYRRGDLVIPMAVACRRTLADNLDASEIFDVTRAGFDFYLDLFEVPYPFTKYDQLFVPEFNAGAMENAGCVTILEDYVFRSKVTDASYERRAETILHELAHMWFGDLVTMRWWDDLWLNESFATYASVLCQSENTRWRQAWTTFANVEKTWAYRQDQLPTTHPIVADINDLADVEVNFDGITYAKGASVLKQLVAWVGRDNFFQAIRRYFAAHAWGNTTLADLLGFLEQTSGRDLASWSQEWLQTAQINVLRPQFELDDAGAYASFSIEQSAPADYPTLRSHRLAVGLYDVADGALQRRERVELDVTGASTEVTELVGERAADLVLVNDDDLTYAKIRLDPASMQTLRQYLGTFADSLPRALGWVAAWDMTRDAELPARAYVDLVQRNIGSESDISLSQSLQRQAISALYLFTEPSRREAGLAAFAAVAHEHLLAAEPGSDAQLAWARTLTGIASSDEHLALIVGLLDGSSEIPGLATDADLRWLLLRRLVTTGRAGEPEIAAELARDDTAAGARNAAACRASRPTSEAKEAAWRSIMDDDSLPNAVQAAVIGGFSQPDQTELTEPFVERYFEAVPAIWAERTSEIAQNIVVGLYPSYRIDASTIERTDRFLAENDSPPALRRLMLESRDAVARALRARARDAAED